MNWYYLVFFVSYHLTGMVNFYYDMMNGSEKSSVSKVNKYIKGIYKVLTNTGIISFISFYIMRIFIEPYLDPVFDRRIEMMRFLFSSCVLDVLRYASHRLFHTRLLYRFHQENHFYYLPPGWLTACTHPVDWVLGNLVPCAIPVLITGMHFYTTLLWIAILTVSSVNMSKPERRAHYIFKGYNYGIGIFMDKMFGTADTY